MKHVYTATDESSLAPSYRERFDLISELRSMYATKPVVDGPVVGRNEKWLLDLDSNQEPSD